MWQELPGPMVRWLVSTARGARVRRSLPPRPLDTGQIGSHVSLPTGPAYRSERTADAADGAAPGRPEPDRRLRGPGSVVPDLLRAPRRVAGDPRGAGLGVCRDRLACAHPAPDVGAPGAD